MPDHERSVFSPVLDKLAAHSLLDTMDRQAFLALPHRYTSYGANAYLSREGAKTDTCMVLISGYAYASKMTSVGARQIVSLHVAGDILDLDNSLLPNTDHSVQTVTRSDVAHVAQRDMLNLAETFPNIARALWRDTLIDASLSREWLLNVGRRCARERIAHFLCELAVRQTSVHPADGTQFYLPLTQEQVGDAIGLTAVHVNRTLQSLRRDQLISQDQRHITIINWRALQAAGDFSRAYLQESHFLLAGIH